MSDKVEAQVLGLAHKGGIVPFRRIVTITPMLKSQPDRPSSFARSGRSNSIGLHLLSELKDHSADASPES